MAETEFPQHLCGWHGHTSESRRVAATMPLFASAAPHLMAAPAPTQPILLYKAWRDVLGKDPAYVAQEIGDCVSFGHAHGNDLLECIEISLGEPSVFEETDTEFIYGESRKVGGILGRSDGSVGAYAVKAMTTVGTVSRAMLGSDGAYSGSRAKSWGLNGPPASIETLANPFKLGSAANVATWDELVAAVSNGYPVTICTGQGFTLTRDEQGFCRARGSWGHCMCIAAVRFDRPGALILQSWGPDSPTGPTALDQPSFSFWVDRPVIESILAEGDSWALSKAASFKERELPPSWSYNQIF